MPIAAYILLKLKPIPIEELEKNMQKFKEIKSCSVVTGEIDVILYAETTDAHELFELVRKLRDLPFVIETRTSIIISRCLQRES